MRRRRFVPTWRGAKEEIELVERPTREWFRATSGHVRFSLMSDGIIWWGDGYDVLHLDVCRFRDGECRPLLVGIVKIIDESFVLSWDGEWTVIQIQFFLASTSSVRLARPFLRRLTTWIAIEDDMGGFRWKDMETS